MTTPPDPLVAVSYGGGVNSTAMLVGAYERGLRPDLILFADTGGERPETYDFVDLFGEWLESAGFPDIDLVVNKEHETLEEECHRNHTLPSLAFGFRGCSVKWKRQPMDRHLRAYEGHGQIERWIGIDADESHRGKIEDTARFRYRFPLLEWDWGRDECVEAIQRHDLPVPPKSACFFCPAAKKREVIALEREHPDLFQRAVAMERQAILTTIKGLGRHWSWEELLEAEKAQLKLWPEMDVPCMCYDGD